MSPRPDPFTPRRRLLMKAILWVVFAGTMGLAAIIVRVQRESKRVDLEPEPITVSGVSLRLPLDWRVRNDTSDPGIIAEAIEPRRRAGAGSRAFTVYQEMLGDSPGSMRSPAEYLAQRFGVAPLPAPASGEDYEIPVSAILTRAISFGPYPGLCSSHFAVVPGNAERTVYQLTYAAAVLPSGRAVAIKIERRGGAGGAGGGGSGGSDYNDLALVDEVARHMTFADEPAVVSASGERIALEGGIEVTTPSPFRAVAGRDPDRTSRRLWYHVQPSERDADYLQRWGSIELIPCVLVHSIADANSTPPSPAPPPAPAASDDDVASEIRTMLLASDPRRWRNAAVKRLADGQFQVDPASADNSPSGEPVVTRAYLQTNPQGRALLAVLRGPSGDLAAYWNQLRSTIRFTPPAVPPAVTPAASPDAGAAASTETLIRAGAAEASRLRELPLDQLLAAAREDQYHLWLNHARSERPQIGWSRIQWTPAGGGRGGGASAGPIAAETELRLRPIGAGAGAGTGTNAGAGTGAGASAAAKGGEASVGMIKLTQSWSASTDWNRYRCDATRVQHAPGSIPRITAQRSDQRGDTITLSSTINERDPVQLRRTIPANFLPGAALEHLIGKLSPGEGAGGGGGGGGGLILSTDSFPGCQGIGADGFITLIVKVELSAVGDQPSARRKNSAAPTSTPTSANAKATPTTTTSSAPPTAPASERIVTVQINGTGCRHRYRFAPDGSLVSVRFPGGIERIESTQREIAREFGNDPGMSE